MKISDRVNFWQKPCYLPYLQPDLTEASIIAATTVIGFPLPPDYLDLLRIQNGGYIRYTLPDQTLHRCMAGIGPAFPSLTDFEWLQDYEGAVSLKLKGLVPFDGDGHWNICLDYRKNTANPAVTYIDTESDYEEPIAPDFRSYLGMLVVRTDGEFVWQNAFSLEEAARKISSLTGYTFSEQESYDHGYPQFAGKIKDDWIWLAPNLVSDAFIRPGEEHYEELKHRMEKTAQRFPELNENDLLLSSSDNELLQQVVAKLTASGALIDPILETISGNRKPNTGN